MIFTLYDFYWLIGHLLAILATLVNNVKLRFLLAPVIIIVLSFAIISPNGANDLLHYYNYIEGGWFKEEIYDNFFLTLDSIVDISTSSKLLLLRFIIFFSAASLILHLKDISVKGKLFVLAMILCSLGVVLSTNNNLRQGLSAIILCHAIIFLHKNFYFRFIFFLILSSILHKYSIIMNAILLSLYFVSTLNLKNLIIPTLISIIIGLIITIAVGTFFGQTFYADTELAVSYRTPSYLKWLIIFIVWILTYQLAGKDAFAVKLRKLRLLFLLTILPSIFYQEFLSRMLFMSYILDGLYILYTSRNVYSDNKFSFGLTVFLIFTTISPNAYNVIN